jgi:hypothetical protein
LASARRFVNDLLSPACCCLSSRTCCWRLATATDITAAAVTRAISAVMARLQLGLSLPLPNPLLLLLLLVLWLAIVLLVMRTVVDPLLVTVVKSNELEVDKDDLTNSEA